MNRTGGNGRRTSPRGPRGGCKGEGAGLCAFLALLENRSKPRGRRMRSLTMAVPTEKAAIRQAMPRGRRARAAGGGHGRRRRRRARAAGTRLRSLQARLLRPAPAPAWAAAGALAPPHPAAPAPPTPRPRPSIGRRAGRGGAGRCACSCFAPAEGCGLARGGPCCPAAGARGRQVLRTLPSPGAPAPRNWRGMDQRP